jgi:hypothetical protein
MIKVRRNVSLGQWKGCVFLHVGSTAYLWPILAGDRSWGIELVTPMRWLSIRPLFVWRR